MGMARKRSLSPETWSDQLFGELTLMERLMLLGLKSMADDDGRFTAHPAVIKSFVFPFDNLTLVEISEGLQKIFALGLVRLWSAGGREYGDIVGWTDEQKPQYPTPSRIPLPLELSAERGCHTPLATTGAALPDEPNVIHGTFHESSLSPPGGFAEASIASHVMSGLDGSGLDGSSLARARDDATRPEPEKTYWTLSDDDIGGFRSAEIRGAYKSLTGNQLTKKDRDLIEITGSDYPFSSIALVRVMEIIGAKAGKQVGSFAYFRAGITELWKRCIDAEQSAALLAVGAPNRAQIILGAVRREIGHWSRGAESQGSVREAK